MADTNATTYNKILSKGIEANLPVAIGQNKLRFTTDTGRLFLDNEGTDRIEITDFIKGKTKDQILGTLAPLPKFYLASDTQEFYYYDITDDEWKSVRATEAVNASTAQYAVESGHSVNAGTADYATNASSSSYSDNGISNITRSGTTFTVTKSNGSTFTFDQQDNDTTYAEATTASAGLMPALGDGEVKYLREDGTWVVPPDTTYTNGAGLSLNNGTFSIDVNSSSATYDGSGNVITNTYAPLDSPIFTGTPTVPNVSAGDGSSKIANTKYVDDAVAGVTFDNMTVQEGIDGSSTVSKMMTAANLKGIMEGSTYIHAYAPCVEANFDFGELTANGETYSA